MHNNCNASWGCFHMYCLSVQYSWNTFWQIFQKIFCLTLESHEFLLMFPSIIKANVSNKLCLPNDDNFFVFMAQWLKSLKYINLYKGHWILIESEFWHACIPTKKKEYFLINYLERQRRKSEHLIAWKVIYILSQTRIESM